MMSRFPNPHISQPYSRIGFMSLLNKSICISIGKFRTLIFLRRENIAWLACSAMCFLQLRREPLFARYMPRYLYSVTISISFPLYVKWRFCAYLPEVNIRILVFEMLTVSFHWSQYCSNRLSICYKSSWLLLNNTVSSAKRMTINLS